MERVGKTEKKKAASQKDLDNVTTGRKTVKTLFKNQGDAGGMVNKIENVSNESFLIYNYFIPYFLLVPDRKRDRLIKCSS